MRRMKFGGYFDTLRELANQEELYSGTLDSRYRSLFQINASASTRRLELLMSSFVASARVLDVAGSTGLTLAGESSWHVHHKAGGARLRVPMDTLCRHNPCTPILKRRAADGSE